jgi:DNA replication protein DnaC
MIKDNPLLERAKALKLHGLISHWDEVEQAAWVEQLIAWEETEKLHRGLERRFSSARLGRFKLLNEFDWSWPQSCDRQAVEDLMRLAFIKESINIFLCGPNGVGKSTIARNIAHQAIIRGYTVLFVTAGQMLNELASQDGDNALRRRIKYYVQPQLLVIDEMGYLSYSLRHADLLFEIVSQRYEKKSTVVTTNKPFAQWGDMFPNATCVVSLIDRLVHHSEIISIEAKSYRLKEALEQNAKRKEIRANRKIKNITADKEVKII